MNLHASRKLCAAVLAVAAALALSACGKDGGAAQQAGGGHGGDGQAPVVGVVTVHPQEILVSADLPGRLESFRSADVRAQVSGILKKRLFKEDSYVQAGQALYQLEDDYEIGRASCRERV